MYRNQLSRLRAPAILLAISIGTALQAGDLNPPAGVITPTHKTLTQVEPRIAISAVNTPGDADSSFKISQPGSYYLTDNITGVVGKHGIEIAANGVTLDLNGFDLAGIPGMGNFDGVSVTVNDVVNIAVLNGSVRNWGGDGVNLGLSFTDNCRVDGLRVSGNAGLGISVGEASTVTNCSSTLNTSFGIRVARNSTIYGCSVLRNGGDGISSLGDCAVIGCTASFNIGDGFESSTSVFFNCTATNNEGHGINAGTGSSLANCNAISNTGDGIVILFGAIANACTAHNNDGVGIRVGNSNSLGTGSEVMDCSARENVLGGIACTSHCLIRGNTCSDAGSTTSNGPAILATGSLNRIEGNSCIGSDFGVRVDGVNNVIIKNTCSSNAVNWQIAAGNDLAPIVVSLENAAVVSGNTYAGNLGSTDPNANFTY